jgi:hypothetical protein
MIRHAVVLRHDESDSYVDAQLVERVDTGMARRAEDAWKTFLATAKAAAFANGQPFPGIDHGHWNWERKVGVTERLLTFPTLGIECADQVQGLMLLQTDGYFGRLAVQHGSPLVYVMFLATAPWNLPDVTDRPRYRGVGTVLLAAAASISRELGFKGRLGLHSLPKSETWYNRIGMTCLGADSTKDDLQYFEMTSGQAQTLIGEEST